MENGFPGSLQIDTHAYVGGVGGKLPCLAHLVCVLCMVEVYGIFNHKKKYSISLFRILNRVAI